MPRFPGAVTTFDMKSLSESFGLNRINLHLGEFSVREILGSGAVRLQIKLHVIPTQSSIHSIHTPAMVLTKSRVHIFIPTPMGRFSLRELNTEIVMGIHHNRGRIIHP